ncbi:MAG: hypothetical protein D6731_18310 [Planctomycetota bacterium]|nr:MAG: hypothetical protein D6731_18310 [Planctomycetota bacterium]
MRKIKTKGLKIKHKPVDRGPRFCVVLHGIKKDTDKVKEAMGRIFEINDALADQVISKAPVVICKDLDQEVASDYVKKLKSAGDFRVWLESAAGRMKQMNLKQKNGPPPMQAPQIRKH